ncbi:hypothetical protein [Luteitalea sp.]|jgi:hypothetical protein
MHQRDLGSQIRSVASLAPVAGTGSAQNGSAVDRMGFLSAVGVVPWSTSGGVTGGTIAAKFQHSDASGGTYTDYGTAVSVAIPAGPNASGVAEVPVDLSAAKRFIRLVIDSDPTGGTPASIVAGAIVLGGADSLPA